MHFVDDSQHFRTGETFDFKVSRVGVSQNVDVETISGLGRNVAGDVAKGVRQVGDGGKVIVVRPKSSSFTMEQYVKSLMENFIPKQDVEIQVIDENHLPPLK